MVTLFVKRFDDDSKNFRESLKQTFKLENKIRDFIKSVKAINANLVISNVKPIEDILIKVIEISKVDLKKEIED